MIPMKLSVTAAVQVCVQHSYQAVAQQTGTALFSLLGLIEKGHDMLFSPGDPEAMRPFLWEKSIKT